MMQRFLDWFCLKIHEQHGAISRDWQGFYVRCECGRRIPWPDPRVFNRYTEAEMTGIERYWKERETAPGDVIAELERTERRQL